GCIFYGSDNSVEIIAIGENPELNKFIKYCHHGNKDSIVEHVQIEQIPLQDYASFNVEDGVQSS
nr:acylphosphatase [Bacteroidota bacterium]